MATDTDSKLLDLFSKLIKEAQTKENTAFTFIRSWQERYYYKNRYKSFKLVIKALLGGADKLFTNYCVEATSGQADPNKLLVYNQLFQTAEFYKRECLTIKYMLNEYQDFLFRGHVLWSLFGGQRQLEEDFYDPRDKE